MNPFNKLVVRILPLFPKSFIWIFSSRYIAGKTLSDGVRKTRELNGMGCSATMDVLGEDIFTLEEASVNKQECFRVLDTIHTNRLDARLSLKLTALGLKVDKEKCYQNVKEIVEKASQVNNFVRIDMEDSTCTEETLEIYRRLRKGYRNVGAVIQACLRRSRDDVERLIKEQIADLRICKGIYQEPKEIAYKEKEEIRESFNRLVRMMLESGSFVGIATHDKVLVDQSLEAITAIRASKSTYEFQMLLGVAEKMRGEIVALGNRMRVYVPYGEQWHGYCTRRLKENPTIVGHIFKNLFVRR